MDIHKLNQWVVWRHEGEQKVPYSPTTGSKASVTDGSTWATYVAAERVRGGYDGTGFVFTMDDPYCGVDLDDCIHEGEVAPWATEIVEALDSYTEISPSGTGLKVYVLASKSGQRTRTGNIEMYDSGRFFTFTGRQYGDSDSIESRQGEIDELYRNLFPIIEPKGGEGEGFQGEDDALLSKARNVGQPYEFRALYDRGDWSTLDFRSQSEADFKLATMLAFWCGPDQDRIDALFRESALMRDKWDEPRGNSTYGELTIANAIDMCPYFYSGKVTVTDEVQTFLSSAYQWLMTEAWDYRSGPTDRHVYTALLDHAAQHGQEHPEGVTVSMGTRDLTLESGLGSRDTVKNALTRLDDKHSAVEVLRLGKGRKATTYLLKSGVRKVDHKEHSLVYGLGSGRLIRNPSPKGTYTTIGKRNVQVIEVLYANRPQPVSFDELASLLQLSRQRKSDMKRKNLPMLEGLELIAYHNGGYTVPDDIEERLQDELIDSGCKEVYELQRERIAREQEAYRTRNKRKADKVPERKESKMTQEVSVVELSCEYGEDCDGIFCGDDDCRCPGCIRYREGMRVSEEHFNNLYGWMEDPCTYSLSCECWKCWLASLEPSLGPVEAA